MIQLFMQRIKDYPECLKKSSSKSWLKVKRRFKKIAHTKLRRGAEKYRLNGVFFPW